MKIYLVEDEADNFYPLTLLRPLFEIKCGRFNFFEKINKKMGKITGVVVRDYIEKYIEKRYPNILVNWIDTRDEVCFLKANTILYEKIPHTEGVVVTQTQEKVAVFEKVKGGKINIKEVKKIFEEKDTPKEIIKASVYHYPWEIIKDIEKLIEEDIENHGIKGEILKGAVIYGESNLYFGKNSAIEAGGLIDARTGKIYIDEEVRIKGPTVIEGPCFIGRGTIVDGAKIRPGCAIGEVCRIGGEIEATIIHGYSNKHHEGFIGHSYIGEWVNLGALTTNSDLKNNYSNVRVQIKGKTIDTGLLKFGCVIGDHAKTGIGSLINTGSIIGIFANIFGGGVTPKEVPSFSWGYEDVYRLDKLLEVMKKVMKRRDKTPSPEYEELVKAVYKMEISKE